MCARPGQGGCAAAPTCRAASQFPRSANGPPTSEPAELFSRLAHRRRQHLARSSVRSAVHQLGYARCASSFRLFCNLLASQRRRATSLPISRVRRTRDSTAVGPRSVARGQPSVCPSVDRHARARGGRAPSATASSQKLRRLWKQPSVSGHPGAFRWWWNQTT